ncbi:MAG: riboflavin kinase, partial [Desulfotomaculaceae bacterium]|nr:riboflavin kinase [Desulfotomaculaceae bacterium]
EIGMNTLVPANGVYSARVFINGDVYQGVANVGIKPTFHGKKRNIEVHVLDFCRDLYGKWIKISFTRRLRGEKRFASPSELVEQIKRDIIEAREQRSNAGE